MLQQYYLIQSWMEMETVEVTPMVIDTEKETLQEVVDENTNNFSSDLVLDSEQFKKLQTEILKINRGEK